MYFNITGWSNSISFQTYDITYVTGSNSIIYYYSKTDNISKTPLFYHDDWTQNFIFKPSYSSEIELNFASQRFDTESSPYSTVTPQSINNSNTKYLLYFNNRSDKEVRAIIHFVITRAGTEPFYMDNNFFNGSGILYVANNLNHQYKYNNLNDVSFEISQFFGPGTIGL